MSARVELSFVGVWLEGACVAVLIAMFLLSLLCSVVAICTVNTVRVHVYSYYVVAVYVVRWVCICTRTRFVYVFASIYVINSDNGFSM